MPASKRLVPAPVMQCCATRITPQTAYRANLFKLDLGASCGFRSTVGHRRPMRMRVRCWRWSLRARDSLRPIVSGRPCFTPARGGCRLRRTLGVRPGLGSAVGRPPTASPRRTVNLLHGWSGCFPDENQTSAILQAMGSISSGCLALAMLIDFPLRSASALRHFAAGMRGRPREPGQPTSNNLLSATLVAVTSKRGPD